MYTHNTHVHKYRDGSNSVNGERLVKNVRYVNIYVCTSLSRLLVQMFFRTFGPFTLKVVNLTFI